jgi:hypothetical protein
MRRFPRLDANHAFLVRYFRTRGCSVLSTASLGGGAPDAFIAYGLHTAACEFKDPSKPPSRRKLRLDQENWRRGWVGLARTIETTADADRLIEDLAAWCRAEPPKPSGEARRNPN